MKPATLHAKMAQGTSHINFLFFVIFILPFIIQVSAKYYDWHYEGEVGIHTWHANYNICAAGNHQSPIDIITDDTVYDPDLKEIIIWYNPHHPKGQMIAFNDGRTVKIKTVGKFYIANGGLANPYKIDHLHLHWGIKNSNGTEHYIDTESFTMELHIVSYDVKKYDTVQKAASQPMGLAVLGVLFKESDTDNPALNMIVDNLEAMQQPGHPKVELEAKSVRMFLPKDISRYYRYNGSLTTPACYESVIWTIFEEYNFISKKQMQKIRDLFYVYDAAKEQERLNKAKNNGTESSTENSNAGINVTPAGDENTTDVIDLFRKYRFEMVNNFRPVQELNDRVVLRSFKEFSKQSPSKVVTIENSTVSSHALVNPWVTFFLLFLYLWTLV
ncbi:carbonic anhydrase 1 [Octopus bimaculoides]|uniref:carbonic anhydrase 1 n=1 Tax=Octopus bimaculoides TaxID=37653 RepID=UPI00071CF455|nr:carbonic anhydrase 1 [Octopus bimaculoides]|eukprot:XP_014782844.1 PREDICTED: carbonic anhydrase 1-like [Octopus bimaculoides]